ncbi:MAG: hypothetical protein M5U26_22505 [Planctomycetota bacterium]|nr:hypothetical protein [Planctomycetota bacterium]
MSASPRLKRYLDQAPLVLAFAWLGFASPHARAESLTVTTNADTVAASPATDPNDAGGQISLRSALQYLNTRTDADADEIVLPAALNPYTLTRSGRRENAGATGDLDFTRDAAYGALTIRGGGAGEQAVIDAACLDRVFHILSAGGSVTLKDLRLQNGKATDDGSTAGIAWGGGILNADGTLILDRTAIEQCRALGADGADGTLFDKDAGDGKDAGGGGLYSGGGNLQLLNESHIANCSAVGGDGGRGHNGLSLLSIGHGGGDGGFGGNGEGGGIFVAGGTALVMDSSLNSNLSSGGLGGGGGLGAFALVTGGDGGEGFGAGHAGGGGLWAENANITLSNATVSDNSVQGGDGGAGATAGGGGVNGGKGGRGGLGGYGRGGGLSVENGGVNATDSIVSSNAVRTGAGGIAGTGGFGFYGENGGAGGGGGAGFGGGLRVENGQASLTNSTVDCNSIQAASGGAAGAGGNGVSIFGDGGDGGTGGSGGQASGGGVWSGSGTIALIASTLSRNTADGAAGGSGGAAGDRGGMFGDRGFGGQGGHGGEGVGGGLLAETGASTLSNSTVSGNSVNGAAGGAGGAGVSSRTGDGGDGGGAMGGGLYVSDAASADLRNSTVTDNTANLAGAGGTGKNGGASGSSQGGGLFGSGSDTFSAVSSIVAANQTASGAPVDGPDVLGALTDNGNNLVGDLQGSTPVLTAGNPNGNDSYIGDSAGSGVIDPLLDPLQDNGGPTETHALREGSPAIDAGDNPDALSYDQRGAGFDRTVGLLTDTGAYEYVRTGSGLRVRYLRVTINWRLTTRDRVVLFGEFDNPGAVPAPRTPYPFDGLPVKIDVGGQVFNFVLDKHGAAKGGLKLGYNRRTNKIGFVFRSAYGEYHASFADEGLRNDRCMGVDRDIGVLVRLDKTQVTAMVPTKWYSRANIAGNATGKNMTPAPK